MSAPAEQETKKDLELAAYHLRVYAGTAALSDDAVRSLVALSNRVDAVAFSLDALAAAVKGCGKKLDIDRDPPRVHCGIRGHRRRTPYCTTCRDAIDAAISTLTGASRP